MLGSQMTNGGPHFKMGFRQDRRHVQVAMAMQKGVVELVGDARNQNGTCLLGTGLCMGKIHDQWIDRCRFKQCLDAMTLLE